MVGLLSKQIDGGRTPALRVHRSQCQSAQGAALGIARQGEKIASVKGFLHVQFVFPGRLRGGAGPGQIDFGRVAVLHAGRQRRCIGPGQHQVVEQGALLGAIAGGGEGGQLALERGAGGVIQAGRLFQVAHQSRAVHGGQRPDIVVDRNGIDKHAVKGILRQVDIGQLAGGAQRGGHAAGLDVGAQVGDQVAIGQSDPVGGLGHADAGDPGLIHGKQLARLRNAVLVEVAPDAQPAPIGVQLVDLAVAVAVLLGQRAEAVGRGAARVERGGVAEQFAAVVDRAIAVAIHDQETIVRVDPAGPGLDAVGVQVEQHV